VGAAERMTPPQPDRRACTCHSAYCLSAL